MKSCSFDAKGNFSCTHKKNLLFFSGLGRAGEIEGGGANKDMEEVRK